MKTFLALLSTAIILPLAACAAECGPDVFQTTQNFEYEIHGVPDTRPGEWGRHGGWVWAWPIDSPPPGHRIRILSIRGDLLARWQNYPRWQRDGASTGVLIDIKTTPGANGWGNQRGMALGTDGTLVYLQGDITDGGVRIPIDIPFDERNRMAVLHTAESLAALAEGGDIQDAQPHTLYVKVYTYLDETPTYVWVHVEPTLTVTWCWEVAQ